MSSSPSNELVDQLSLDIANRKISLADALRVAFINGHEAGYNKGSKQVGEMFEGWAAKNEIAAPPLDWGWFGEIARWARDEIE